MEKECLKHLEDPELYRCEEREGGVWSSYAVIVVI